MITVSENGGVVKLAFSSHIQVELQSAEGLGEDVTIKEDGVESRDGSVISYYTVGINPQKKGRLPYEVVLHMKLKNQQFSYDEFYIRVDGSSL